MTVGRSCADTTWLEASAAVAKEALWPFGNGRVDDYAITPRFGMFFQREDRPFVSAA